MTLFEVLQLFADVWRFLITHGRATRARARQERRPDRVADRDRDRDIEMNYEIDKLTAV